MGLGFSKVLSNKDIRSFLPTVRPIFSIFFQKLLECPFGHFEPPAALLSTSSSLCNSLSTRPPLCLLPTQLPLYFSSRLQTHLPFSSSSSIFFSWWFSSSHPQPPSCSHFISHGQVLVWNGVTQVSWVW